MKKEILQRAIDLLIAHSEEDFVSKKDAKDASIDLHNLMVSIDSDLNNIIQSVLLEIDRAQIKHPNWPEDLVYAASIVGEENGELTRAAVQYEMEGGKLEEVRTEAIHTCATAIRLLLNIPL